MSFEFIKKLPTPDEIRAEYPVPEKMQELKKKRDSEISDVFTGKSDKFLVIIGSVPQIMRMPYANMSQGLPR